MALAAVPENEGMLPLIDGPISRAINSSLAEANRTEGHRPTAGGTRLRGSQALACARKIGLESIGYPTDLPLDDSTLLVFKAGHIWHDSVIQPVLEKNFGAELEVPANWMPTLSLSCFMDAVYEPSRVAMPYAKVGVEIKSVASFGFDLATGAKRRLGETPGPKAEHIVQSALGCLAPDVQADGQHIIYVKKESGAVAEWMFGVDDPLPHLGGVTPKDLVGKELTRMAGILGRLDAGELPRPVVPGHGIVLNPPARDSKGQPWNCRYCAYQPTCAAVGPDVVPLSTLNKHKSKEK